MDVTPIPTTLEEALSLMAKWRDEQTPIDLTLLHSPAEVNVWRSCVKSISNLDVEIETEDSWVTLHLSNAVFSYSHPRLDELDEDNEPITSRVLQIEWPTGQTMFINESK